MKVHFVCLCTRSKFPSDTDLPAVRLIVAPHRNNCDLSRRQPQRPGWGTEGGDRLAYSYRTIIPLTGYIQILCIIIFSPFPSKVFSQYGHHPLQRSQHCSVDHYWSVQLSVSSERKVTKKKRSGGGAAWPSYRHKYSSWQYCELYIILKWSSWVEVNMQISVAYF